MELGTSCSKLFDEAEAHKGNDLSLGNARLAAYVRVFFSLPPLHGLNPLRPPA